MNIEKNGFLSVRKVGTEKAYLQYVTVTAGQVRLAAKPLEVAKRCGVLQSLHIERSAPQLLLLKNEVKSIDNNNNNGGGSGG